MDIEEQPIVSVFLPMCDAVMSSHTEGRILLECSFDITGRMIGKKGKGLARYPASHRANFPAKTRVMGPVREKS